MVTETKDRRINTDVKRRDDGAKHLPHERDESPDGHESAPRGVMQQAADDLSQGLVDTDLHGLRGVEEAVDASGGAGQARPRADAEQGMRTMTRHRPPTPRNSCDLFKIAGRIYVRLRTERPAVGVHDGNLI